MSCILFMSIKLANWCNSTLFLTSLPRIFLPKKIILFYGLKILLYIPLLNT